MPDYTESGMTIRLPNNNSFRISDCPTWNKLNGHTLSEMDFGWCDTGKIFFLEVKDFTQLAHPKGKKPKKPNDFIGSFVNKGTDMLILLAGIWVGSTHGESMKKDIITTCLSFPSTLCNFKLIFVVKTNDPNAGLWLQDINTKVRNQLKGRVLLFNLDANADVLILDHETAIKNGLPIT